MREGNVNRDVMQFVEDEFAGVQGVRAQELFERFDGDRDELKEALGTIANRKRYVDGFYYEWKPWTKLDIGTALVRLVGYSEWGEFFVSLCESGTERFRAQVWQFEDELADLLNHTYQKGEVEDALFGLAVELLPETPVGGEDFRNLLMCEAIQWLQDRSGLAAVFTVFGDIDPTNEVWDLSFPRFRVFLRGRLQAALAVESKGAA